MFVKMENPAGLSPPPISVSISLFPVLYIQGRHWNFSTPLENLHLHLASTRERFISFPLGSAAHSISLHSSVLQRYEGKPVVSHHHSAHTHQITVLPCALLYFFSLFPPLSQPLALAGITPAVNRLHAGDV